MKKRTKAIIGLTVLCAACAITAGCANTKGPYKGLHKQGHSVTVRYDANGGRFANRDNTTLVDVYPLDKVQKGIKLIAPGDSEKRGSEAPRSTVDRSQYFLEGWYQERALRTDENGNALDENGNLCSVSGKEQGYSYNGRWNFEKDVFSVPSDYKYVEGEFTLTLYAAWIPNFTYAYYEETENGWKEYASYTFNPKQTPADKTIDTPKMDKDDVAMEYPKQFPQALGKTFVTAYKDKEKKTELGQGETFEHLGVIDEEHGVAINSITPCYVIWKEGVWFNIKKIEDFTKNTRLDGCYNLLTDLDFTENSWDYGLTRSDFSGKIVGNGHTISNVHVKQEEIAQTNGGLFGRITDAAEITDVKFENITYEMTTGSRLNPASFGLFTGNLSEKAKIENVSVSGTFLISGFYRTTATDKDGYFSSYSIGLLSGNLVTNGIEYDIELSVTEAVSDYEFTTAQKDEIKVKFKVKT